MTTSRKKSFLLSFSLSMSIIFLIAMSLNGQLEEMPENANNAITYAIKLLIGLRFRILTECDKANEPDLLFIFVHDTLKFE